MTELHSYLVEPQCCMHGANMCDMYAAMYRDYYELI